jgi:hypothetical protein
MPAQRLLQRAQSTIALAPHQGAPYAFLTVIVIASPETTGRVQHVDVRHAGKWRLHPVQLKARVDERDIERLAVVRHHRSRVARRCSHRFEQHALGGKAGEKELADAKDGAIEPGAADQEGVAARPARQARRLEVDEQHPPAARRAGQQREARPRPLGRRQTVGHGHAAMAVAGGVLPIDDQEAVAARFTPFAPEGRRRVRGVWIVRPT